MSQFSLIYLFVFIVSLAIFICLLFLKNKTLQIRAYMILLADYMATLFCFVVFLSAHNVETMKFWLNISHYTGPIVNIALLYLIATFYYNDKNPPLWINTCILISVIPLLTRDLFGFMNTVKFIQNPIGNIVVYGNSALSLYYYIHTFILLFFIITLFIVKIRTTKIRRLRKLSLFLLITTGFTWILSVPVHFILQNIFSKYGILVPATGYLFFSVMVFALFYAVFKYNFMKINIPYTVDNIMCRISDSILLTDANRNIVQVNDAARITFSAFKEKLEDLNMDILFPGLMGQCQQNNNACAIPENYSGFRKLPHPKKHNHVLDMSAEPINDSFGDFIGLLIVCRANNKLDQARHAFGLTIREIEIIIFLYDGLEYQEIAEKLNLSMNTVRNHIHNIYSKTGAKNKTILLKTVF